MQLEDMAGGLRGPAAQEAVARWLGELAAEPDGPIVTGHIQAENNLPLHPEGTDAVGRFVRAVEARPPGGAVSWYRETLNRADLDLPVHGPPADAALPDVLCKVVEAWSVWKHYGSIRLKPNIPYGGVGSPRYRAKVEAWLRDWVCAATYLDALDPAALVSGRPPSVFSTFVEDRDAKFPPGTRSNECRKVVGLDLLPHPTGHALFRYSGTETGPARVPTAFDAGTHPHFRPPPAGAGCGETKNLGTRDGSGGVREVCVRPFPVARLRQPEFIEG